MSSVSLVPAEGCVTLALCWSLMASTDGASSKQ